METVDAMNDFFESVLPAVPEVIVIGNGEFPSHRLPLSLLDKVKRVVCCDGGTDAYVAYAGKAPDLIIGDGDSLSLESKERFKDIIRYNPDQETNDQTKAVEYLQRQGVCRVAFLASTGKREDHTLGNISLLIEYMRKNMQVAMFTDYGVFVPAVGTKTFCSFPGQQVSIFNVTAVGMKSEGLLYPIRDFKNWWEGTLNESVGASFTVSCAGEYLVYRTYC